MTAMARMDLETKTITENTEVETEYTETMIDIKNFDWWTNGVLL